MCVRTRVGVYICVCARASVHIYVCVRVCDMCVCVCVCVQTGGLLHQQFVNVDHIHYMHLLLRVLVDQMESVS